MQLKLISRSETGILVCIRDRRCVSVETGQHVAAVIGFVPLQIDLANTPDTHQQAEKLLPAEGTVQTALPLS